MTVVDFTPAPRARIAALVIAQDARATGGINNFLRVMRIRYRPRVAGVRFASGRRHRERSRSSTARRLLRDYLRFGVLMLRRRFDVLHVNPSLDTASTPRDLVYVWLCALLRPSTRVLVFYRGWKWSTVALLRRSRVARALFLATHHRVARVLVLSAAFREALVALGVPAERIFVASTMFEGAALAPLLRDMPAERRRILFLSRFLPAKGGAPLLEAFARIHARFPGWSLVMAGDGPQRAELEALAGRLGLGDRVVFTGYVGGARKMRLLVEASIFALPTRHAEGMPNAILEAMAAGQAIVATPVGGIPDIVAHGYGGVLLDDPDGPAIADALARYMADPALCARAGAANRAAAWARWESAIVSDGIADHYAALAGGPRA